MRFGKQKITIPDDVKHSPGRLFTIEKQLTPLGINDANSGRLWQLEAPR
jgi:hypothetical protein